MLASGWATQRDDKAASPALVADKWDRAVAACARETSQLVPDGGYAVVVPSSDTMVVNGYAFSAQGLAYTRWKVTVPVAARSGDNPVATRSLECSVEHPEIVVIFRSLLDSLETSIQRDKISAVELCHDPAQSGGDLVYESRSQKWRRIPVWNIWDISLRTSVDYFSTATAQDERDEMARWALSDLSATRAAGTAGAYRSMLICLDELASRMAGK